MFHIGVFEMVVLIVAISAAARIYRAKHGIVRTGRDREEFAARPDPDTTRMREELQALKERVVVLERIATENDRGLTLDREIEALRSRD